MVGAGAGAVVVALVYQDRLYLRFWISIVAAAIGLYVGIDMIHSLNPYGEIIQVQNGGYLAIFAGLLLLVGVIPDLRR